MMSYSPTGFATHTDHFPIIFRLLFQGFGLILESMANGDHRSPATAGQVTVEAWLRCQSLIAGQRTPNAPRFAMKRLSLDSKGGSILHKPNPMQRALFLASLSLLGILSSAPAATRTWMGSVSTDFYNPANWSPNGIPVAGDTLNSFDVTRAFAQLVNLGAPRFSGDEQTDTKVPAQMGGAQASANPRGRPHYTAICHPFVEADLTQNSTFVLASSYSDVNKLYNYEVGQWHGIRFCSTNMCPYWIGAAQITGTPGTAGALATNTYYIIVTASDTQNQYESYIAQVSGALSVTGSTGSISVVLPALTGYTYNVYIGTTTSPTNLALSASGPTVGPQQGQAVQLAPGTTVVLTGIGAAQTPPAAPAYVASPNTITVYPTFIIGRGAYGQVVLDEIKITWLDKGDKSDPLNQLRVVGWKVFYGTVIKNNQFLMRIESTSNFNTTFG